MTLRTMLAAVAVVVLAVAIVVGAVQVAHVVRSQGGAGTPGDSSVRADPVGRQ